MKTERGLLCSVKVEEICKVFSLVYQKITVRDFFTEETRGKRKEEREREEFLVGFILKKNYNYIGSQDSQQIIKKKKIHNSCEREKKIK